MIVEKKSRLIKGLITGIIFGFLLQQGGVTHYQVIIGQLLLEDFTVLKIMLTATITGMVGVYFLNYKNKIKLTPKSGSIIRSVFGGLIFGTGFALLGYCPGTAAGAVGQGSLDALIPGIGGLILGSALFANLYPKIKQVIAQGSFKQLTIPEQLSVKAWKVILPLVLLIVFFLIWLERVGL